MSLMVFFRVSSIEGKSSHPMATALTDYAYLHSVVPKPERVEQFQNFPGEGIYGRIDGVEIFIGNKKISSRAQCTTGEKKLNLFCKQKVYYEQQSSIYIYIYRHLHT